MKKNSFAFLFTMAMMLSVTACGNAQTKEISEQAQSQTPEQEQTPIAQNIQSPQENEVKNDIGSKRDKEMGKVISVEDDTITISLQNRKVPRLKENEQEVPQDAQSSQQLSEQPQLQENDAPPSEQKTITLTDSVSIQMETENGQLQDADKSKILEGTMIRMEYDTENELQSVIIMQQKQALEKQAIEK